ncbi:MAG: DUF3822 family protein [Bacteroidota bacterium]|nr:DUF3822 family protein [Bacteroidota bacterium]
MKNISFFSDDFSVGSTSGYNLSLQAGEHSYAYSILDFVRNRYVAVKYQAYDKKYRDKPFYEKMEIIIKDDAFLSKNYKSINFAYISSKSILVPTPLFSKKNLKTLFKHNQPLADTEELHFNYLESIDAYNVFALPSQVTTSMVNRFPEIKFFHHATSFINQTIEEEKLMKFKLPFVRVHLNKGFFDLLVIISDKPVLYNTFLYKTDADIIYHILSVMKQLEIKPVKSHVRLSGSIEKDSALITQMKNYMASPEILKPRTSMAFEFNEVDEHQLYNVLNLHKCE